MIRWLRDWWPAVVACLAATALMGLTTRALDVSVSISVTRGRTPPEESVQ